MTNLEVAQAARLRPILEVAEESGLGASDFESLGKFKGKLTYEAMERLPKKAKDGKLVLVTAITPTPSGEGKTTVTIGLAQALRKLGKNAIPAIREPALGPVMGVKGGACGGGYSQVLPMEDINLFFNGDFPAVTAAHNLLSASLDAHIQHGDSLRIDLRMPVWPRTMDMNDRALREVIVGLGGRSNGFPRQESFVITPASEVMAVLCLSRSLSDLRERLGNILVGIGLSNQAVRASELKVQGAMAALLRDAIRPNLVQTIEGGPAFVHGGPFANIAHGCSSIIATECALGLGDVVITEAGFGADLGAEKFMDIVAPKLGRGPDAIVLVATVRALKHHGQGECTSALREGMANLFRHVKHLRHYGPPVIVAVNRRAEDADVDLNALVDGCREQKVAAVVSDPYGMGGEGCLELGETVWDAVRQPTEFQPLYAETLRTDAMIRTVNSKAYGGMDVEFSDAAKRRMEWCEKNCYVAMRVCVAKTQHSLSDDPRLLNAPEGFKLHVREVRPSAGAGFLVAICGDMLLMPGLGKEPAAFNIDVDPTGKISGLF
jgi:formate--tetrahydrofolate ligase